VVGVVVDVGNQFRAEGWESFFDQMIALSIYLAVFNLIPFPALDGARLGFLLYEFITRKRPNAKVETAIHVVGMLALLSLGMIVLLRDSWQSIVGFFG
jgi:regulator of sigma E protease